MKLLLIILLITSCSHGYYSYSDNNWHAPSYHETKIVCEKNYIYNQHTGYCHYSLPPKLEVKPIEPVQSKQKTVKRLKRAKNESIDCVKAISKMKQCGVNI